MTEIEIINKNNLPGINLEEITIKLTGQFPLMEKATIDKDTIILKGDADDFEFFMIELDNILPVEYCFTNEIKNNEYCEITVQLTLQKTINDWEELIKELNNDERKLSQLKEDYAEQEREIIKKTDFNKIYNANNDKIRKAHVKKELKPLADEKENLEFKINNSKRKLSLLKAKTYAEIELMKIIKQ